MTITQQAAFINFSKQHTRWKKKVLDNAWSKWRSFDKALKQVNKKIARGNRIVRRILIQIWSRQKHNAWEIWGGFVKIHQRARRQIERVIKLVYSRIYHAILKPTNHVFKKWHWIYIADKDAELNKLRRISMLQNSRYKQIVELGKMKAENIEQLSDKK